MPGLRLEVDRGEHARPEHALRRHLEGDGDGPRGRVHGRPQAHDGGRETPPGEGLDLKVGGLVDAHPRQVLLRHLDPAQKRREVGDPEEPGAGGHELRKPYVAGHDQGLEGRPDLGVGELNLGALELRLRRGQLRQRAVVGLAADQPLVPRRPGAVVGELRLVAGDAGDRGLVLRLALVDPRHQLARADDPALLGQDLGHRPRGPGDDIDLVLGLEGAVGLQELRDGAAGDGLDPHRHRRCGPVAAHPAAHGVRAPIAAAATGAVRGTAAGGEAEEHEREERESGFHGFFRWIRDSGLAFSGTGTETGTGTGRTTAEAIRLVKTVRSSIRE